MNDTELTALALLLGAFGTALLLYAYSWRRDLSRRALPSAVLAPVRAVAYAPVRRIPTRPVAHIEHVGATAAWSPMASIGARPTSVPNARRDDASAATTVHDALNAIERELSAGLEDVLARLMAQLDGASQVSAIKTQFATGEYAIITTLPQWPANAVTAVIERPNVFDDMVRAYETAARQGGVTQHIRRHRDFTNTYRSGRVRVPVYR